MAPQGGLKSRPGWKKFRVICVPSAPVQLTLLIASKKAPKLKPKCFITRIERKMLPLMSNTALMICTQVVASIPPKTT